MGDGSYLFSVPGTVYWIAERYNIPVLTVVLNNQGEKSLLAIFTKRSDMLTFRSGWNAPRKSLLLVHPDGLGSKVGT